MECIMTTGNCDGITSGRGTRYFPLECKLRYLLLAALMVFGRVQSAPLEVYGRLPSLENVAISPDGTRLAFVRTQGDERVLAIVALDDGKAMAVVRIGKTKLRDVRWADDKRLMIVTSVTQRIFELTGGKREWYMLQIYDVDKKQLASYPRLKVGLDEPTIMNVIGSLPEEIGRASCRERVW